MKGHQLFTTALAIGVLGLSACDNGIRAAAGMTSGTGAAAGLKAANRGADMRRVSRISQLCEVNTFKADLSVDPCDGIVRVVTNDALDDVESYYVTRVGPDLAPISFRVSYFKPLLTRADVPESCWNDVPNPCIFISRSHPDWQGTFAEHFNGVRPTE